MFEEGREELRMATSERLAEVFVRLTNPTPQKARSSGPACQSSKISTWNAWAFTLIAIGRLTSRTINCTYLFRRIVLAEMRCPARQGGRVMKKAVRILGVI
jgi:hypothetical protein